MYWVCFDFDFVFKADRLVHLIDAVAVDVKFPAVVYTTKPAFLVASQKEGGKSMWAVLIEDTNIAIGITEPDQVFAKHA